MKRKKYAITAPLICLLVVLIAAAPPGARAQTLEQDQEQVPQQTPEQVPQETEDPNRDEEPPSAAEMVTDYLKQDIFLTPGVGLKSVKIGMPFEQVLETWGEPSDEGRDNLINKKWTYKVANHTTITLIGNDDVDMMRVTGGFNSPYVTAEGASFGMAQHQLASIYGPAEENNNVVNYARRGVGFELERGQVAEIRVFSPKN